MVLSLAGALQIPPAREVVAGERATTKAVVRPAEKSDDDSDARANSRKLSRAGAGIPSARRLSDSEMTYDNLAAMLRSDNHLERYAAANSLDRIGMWGWQGPDQQAIQLAITALEDPYWAVRYEAAKAIQSRGKLAQTAVRPLIDALVTSEEPLVRNRCVLALQATGRASKALHVFELMLRDGDQLDAVVPVVLESGPEGRKMLTAAADSPNADIRLWSKAALAKGGEDTIEYVKELTAAIESGRKDRILTAWKSAHLAGSQAAPAGKLWAGLLTNRDLDLRCAAASALQYSAPKDKVVVESLITGTRDARIRDNCVVALGRIGPQAAAAIPELLDLMEKEERARFNVLLALERIDSKSPAALPVLIRVLRKTNEKKWPDKEVIAAIGAYGPAAKAAVPDLVTAMHIQSFHPYHIDAAIWALGQIGPDARAARDDVLRFTRGGPFVETARVAMKRIDAQDPATMPPPEAKYTGRTLHGTF